MIAAYKKMYNVEKLILNQLNQNNENWISNPNEWQQGRLTGYYWNRIFPKVSPIGSSYSIGPLLPHSNKGYLEGTNLVNSLYMSIDYREFSKIIYFQDKDCKLRFAISDIIKEFLKNNTKELYHINLIIRYIDITQIVREFTYNNRDAYSL